MGRAANTREQIIDRARNLMQRHGFEGFSYKDISTHLGIKNAAVHYHFPAKVDLGLAMIQQFTEEVRERIRWATERDVPVREQLNAYFKQVDSELTDQSWAVCPMGALATCFESVSAPMQSAARQLQRVVHGWMKEILELGRQRGEISFEGSAEAKAMEIACAVQGARQISRVVERNVVREVAEQIRTELFKSKQDSVR